MPIKHRPKTKTTALARYPTTPAIVAALANNGIAALSQVEADLTLSLGADRRRQMADDMIDRARCEAAIERRAAERSTARAEQLEAFAGQVEGETS